MAVMVQDATAAPRSVTILGSTGSVGCSTIDLIERNPDAYVVEALTARRNADLLVEQAKKLRPRYVAIGDEEHYHAVKAGLSGSGIEVAAGKEAIVAAARHPAGIFAPPLRPGRRATVSSAGTRARSAPRAAYCRRTPARKRT